MIKLDKYKLLNPTEDYTVRKLELMQSTMQQGVSLSGILDSSIVGDSFKEELAKEISRIHEMCQQRIRFINQRAIERDRKSKILAVDFSRQRM